MIIDAKFYEHTLQEHFERESFHSSHLYQLMAYLQNMRQRDGADSMAEGLLLYPTVKDSIDLNYVIQGHKVRIHTVNPQQIVASD